MAPLIAQLISASFQGAAMVAAKGKPMKHVLLTGLIAATLACSMATLPTRAMAGDWPMAAGDFWEITGVHVKDGGDLAYATFLATEWKADQEYAKSKGWIKGYTILSNIYARKGEPDLYLVVISERLANGAESEKRGDEYIAWKKKSNAQLVKESGNRLEIREIENNMLLQELKIK
jgi:hypothetical protein